MLRLNLPLFQIAFLLIKINPDQYDFFAALTVFLRILLVQDLSQGDLRVLVALEFDNIDFFRESDDQIDAPFARQYAASNVHRAGGGHHQIKNGMKIGFVPLGFDVIGNGCKNRLHTPKKRLKIFLSKIARQT